MDIAKIIKPNCRNVMDREILWINDLWISNGCWLVPKPSLSEVGIAKLKEKATSINELSQEEVEKILNKEKIAKLKKDELNLGVLYLKSYAPYVKTTRGICLNAYFVVFLLKCLEKIGGYDEIRANQSVVFFLKNNNVVGAIAPMKPE